MSVPMGGRVGRVTSGTSGLEARWAFSDRSGGVSAPPFDSLNLADHVGDDPVNVSVNRGRLADRIGVSPDQVAVISAAHGNDVARVNVPGTVAGVDALLTDQSYLGLMALAADCVPMVLSDVDAGRLAVVHSGWRGVASNVAAATVAAMVDSGARADRIVAAIGPAICPGCYEVSTEVAAQVGDVIAASVSSTRSGTPAIDVQAGVAAQLGAAGVIDIRTDTSCTYENEALYSYRRDGQTGRQGVVAAMMPIARDADGGVGDRR